MTLCKFSFDDYYNVPWDTMYEGRANDNPMYGPEWFYAGIERKIDEIKSS